MDIKEWIESKANDIAFDSHYCDFYDLSKKRQAEIYNQAIELFGNKLTDMIEKAIHNQQNIEKLECVSCFESPSGCKECYSPELRDVCYGCLDYTVRCGKYPCEKVS